MSSWSRGNRPITLAILAMGGEGGGVLSGWIADVAGRSGYHAQTTQVAGVAQRTGATVYYVELYPGDEPGGEAFRAEPVLSLFPIPGECDIVVASELMEAGRAVQRGFVTPDRTTFIASTNRVYSIDEKSVPGDGRADSAALLAAAAGAAKRFVGADFMAQAVAARSVISASLFGALAGSGALPFPREAFEAAIESSGKGVKQSLAAFDRGYATAQEVVRAAEASPSKQQVLLQVTRRQPTPEELEEARKAEQAAADPASLIGRKLQPQGRRILREFPAPARLMLVRGCQRTALYQDEAYASRYLDRVARVAAIEPDADEAVLTTEVARYAALLLTYQDTIHVALQKVRAARLEQIRAEARAGGDELVDVYEYLHPEVEEITDTMPAAVGKLLRSNKAFGALVRGVSGRGIVVNTTSAPGFTILATLANLRPMRPATLRFKRVQREVDAWIDAIIRHARTDAALAIEVARVAHVIKGYGETFERGTARFEQLMAAAERLQGRPDAAATLARLRLAALADESGESLEKALAELDDGTIPGEGVDGAPDPGAPAPAHGR